MYLEKRHNKNNTTRFYIRKTTRGEDGINHTEIIHKFGTVKNDNTKRIQEIYRAFEHFKETGSFD